jgi:hypothetical protein
MGNQPMATSHRPLAIGDGQQAMGNQQSTTSQKLPRAFPRRHSTKAKR